MQIEGQRATCPTRGPSRQVRKKTTPFTSVWSSRWGQSNRRPNTLNPTFEPRLRILCFVPAFFRSHEKNCERHFACNPEPILAQRCFALHTLFALADCVWSERHMYQLPAPQVWIGCLHVSAEASEHWSLILSASDFTCHRDCTAHSITPNKFRNPKAEHMLEIKLPRKLHHGVFVPDLFSAF